MGSKATNVIILYGIVDGVGGLQIQNEMYILHEEKIDSLFIITEDLTKAKNRFEENICNIQMYLIAN